MRVRAAVAYVALGGAGRAVVDAASGSAEGGGGPSPVQLVLYGEPPLLACYCSYSTVVTVTFLQLQ